MLVNMNEPLYSSEKLAADALSLSSQYDKILKCVTIGSSHDNRDIIMLKLGLGKKYMICCGGVHGRESINPIVLMRIIEYYAQLYVTHKERKISLKKQLENTMLLKESEYENMLYGDCIYELLQTFTILFIPLLNPDGYMASLKGFQEIRNGKLREICLSQGISNTEWKYNGRGVDINRNFTSRLWTAKTPDDTPASENETKALISVFKEYPANGFLDFHSRGRQIYYHRSAMPDKYNNRQLEIATRFAEITNYELVPPEDEMDAGDSGGNTVHYFSENFNEPALTIETVDEEAAFPLDMIYRFPVFEELKLLIFEFGSMIV